MTDHEEEEIEALTRALQEVIQQAVDDTSAELRNTRLQGPAYEAQKCDRGPAYEAFLEAQKLSMDSPEDDELDAAAMRAFLAWKAEEPRGQESGT